LQKNKACFTIVKQTHAQFELASRQKELCMLTYLLL